jgi:hypothetical protein
MWYTVSVGRVEAKRISLTRARAGRVIGQMCPAIGRGLAYAPRVCAPRGFGARDRGAAHEARPALATLRASRGRGLAPILAAPSASRGAIRIAAAIATPVRVRHQIRSSAVTSPARMSASRAASTSTVAHSSGSHPASRPCARASTSAASAVSPRPHTTNRRPSDPIDANIPSSCRPSMGPARTFNGAHRSVLCYAPFRGRETNAHGNPRSE